MNFIEKIDQIPVPDLYRRRTDNLCTFVAVLLSASLFIYSFWTLNTNNAMKVILPSDGDGNVCGHDYPAYPYLYFGDLKDMSKRLCVTHCPALHDKRVNCRPTSRIGCFRRPPLSPSTFRMYDTEPLRTSSKIGLFCVPRDPTVREELLMRSQLWYRSQFINFYDTIIVCLLITIILGLIYMQLVQIYPKFIHYASMVLGSFVTIGLGVWILLYRSPEFERLKSFRIFIAVVLTICGLIGLICLMVYRRYLRVSSVFLNHSTKFLTDRPSTLVYILLLLVFTIGLFILTAFELVAVWSSAQPTFTKSKVFYVSQGSGAMLLSILIFVQLYWGLAFLREFFNFCVSGMATNWYFNKPNQCFQPFSMALRFHFGSIVGGAFMFGFFSVGNTIMSLFKPDNSASKYGKCYNIFCGWLTSLFELVRSDTMSYINLTGLPYCNASRFCQFLCNNTRLYNGNEPSSKFYRISAHFLLVSLVCMVGLFYKQNMSLWVELFIMVITLFTVTFFIDIHADASQAISICFLTEEYLEVGDFRQVKKASPELVNELLAASNISQQEMVN